MKISYNWLKDYLPINLPANVLKDILTQIGLEVAKVEEYSSVPGNLNGLVVGHVLKCERIAGTDHLHYTEVNVGDKVLPIVCGAPNVAEGQKVVVAPVGVTLYPYNGEPFKLKKAKIRGVRSEGMIVAEDEIGLGPDHSGIIVLPDDAKPGEPAKKYFDIYQDTVFEIDLTPNRTDAFSHFGVARDLYAYLKIHEPNLDVQLRLPSVEDFKIDEQTRTIDVEIENPEACPRYTGLTITDVEIKPSPKWMQNRLKAIGQKPINNVVDITNYVLHEIGHPLHAFDADLIPGGKIRVKTAQPGTKFITLFGDELTLSENDLTIAGADGTPLVLAGIVGGLNSGVTDKTRHIFLESAFFNPTWIRKSAKKFGISTDSSYRFERGVDPNNTVWTIKRAALLIKQLAGGKIASNIIDRYPRPIEPFKVTVKYDYINRLLGIKFKPSEIKQILDVLEIKITKEDNEKLQVLVPTYRWDVRRPADIAEEIIRIYGFNNVPLPSVIKSVHQKHEADPEIPVNIISDYLSSLGFNEIINTSLQTEKYYDGLQTYKVENLVRLLNPLSSDVAVLRQTLLFGGLESIIRNINRKNLDLKFYELGNVYFQNPDEKDFDRRYSEAPRLALWLTGLREKPNWRTPAKESDFYLLKTYVDNILKRLNYSLDQFTAGESQNELLNYGLEYKIDDKTAVFFGAVSNKILRIFEIEQPVYFAEFDWNLLLENQQKEIKFKPLPKFPAVRRDLALLLDENIKYQQVVDVIRKTEQKLIEEINIFDVYKGKNIPEGKKSYAISIILRHPDKTLTDKQVDKTINRILQALQKELGATLR